MIEAIGRYKVQERLGGGALGDTYRARDMQHGRLVAIKVLPAAIAADVARRRKLLEDARAAAALSHPNIASLIEIGDEPDRLFLVFDFVAGKTLENLIAAGFIDTRQSIELAAQIADALAEGHAKGLPHGALTPASVIVTPTGHAKILDYGLSGWTSTDNARASNEAADIYSLGILLFQMLTGKEPPERVPAPGWVTRAVPREPDPIVGKALAKETNQRYSSALTLAAELRAVGAVLDVRSDAGHALPRRARSGSGKWIAAAAIVAAAAIAWLILR